MAKTDHFPVATRVIDGDRSKTITVRVATCSVCGEHEDVTDNKPGGLAVAPIAQKFRARGWEIGARRVADKCPKHAKHPPRITPVDAPKPVRKSTLPPTPATSQPFREALAPIVATIEPQPEPPMAEPAPAEKPEWTREQRRKARDALDVHYDDERLRYRGDWTDKSLADSINVPRALLAEVRDDYYGPDRNEAEAKRRANMVAALAEAEKTLERLMNTATDCETLINNLKKALA